MSAAVLSKMISCDEELRKNQIAVKASSCWTGMSGIDQWGHPYATVSLDEIASGCGAFSFRDGIDQGGTYTIPRSEAGDCEVWEQASPILYLFRRNSMGFGHGKYRGGRGIVLGWVGRGTDNAGDVGGQHPAKPARRQRPVGRPFRTGRAFSLSLRTAESPRR